MSRHVTLMGAEGVERAGYKMQQAADDMERAANTLSSALEQHQRFMDDWLERLRALVEKRP